MADPGPTRTQGDLAEMLDTLLDKGVVVNADVAVSVGDTELLGIELRAAIASFETAAEYGLAFPAGTDVERVRAAAGVEDPKVGAAEPEVDDAEEADDSEPSPEAEGESDPETASTPEAEGESDPDPTPTPEAEGESDPDPTPTPEAGSDD